MIKKIYKTGVLKILNASAGSGKTYYLILEYILILFKKNNLDTFKKILVLSFTRKSSKEIKNSIIENLKYLSYGINNNFIFNYIQNILDISFDEIKNRSNLILINILHNYNDFNISTIDSFNYKIINYSNIIKNNRIEFDQKYLLSNTINIFLSKINILKNQNNSFIINFCLKKINTGNSWNLDRELNEVCNLLMNENNLFFIDKINYLSIKKILLLHDFINNNIDNVKFFFKKILHYYYKKYILIFINNINIIYFNVIFDDFLKKIFSPPFKNPFNERTKNIFRKKILLKIKKTEKKIFKKYFELFYIKVQKYYNRIINNYIISYSLNENIILLYLINRISKLLKIIKKNQNIIFNSDMNFIINKKIKNNNTPYIYEKIGELYHYYFIDEFQDTSYLQWINIKPLIENILSINGKVILAGDLKQSIYGWRGVKINEFIKFINDNSNKYIKSIKKLKYNFRSSKIIIHFNNDLYLLLSNKLNNKYKTIYNYKNITQKIYKKNDGYVELIFFKKKEYMNNIYISLKNKIQFLVKKGYKYSDITILVRKNEESLLLSNLLINDNIMVSSSESLLLDNSWPIKYIIGFFKIISYPFNYELRLKWLLILIENSVICLFDKLHDFLLKICSIYSLEEFFNELSKYGFKINFKLFFFNPSLYSLSELLIKSAKINKTFYKIEIQFFLDFIFNNIDKIGNSIEDFIKYWDLIKKKESIVLLENNDAINIMTIHKSKGLEFPIVIIPFANWNMIKQKNIGKWIKFDSEYFNNNINTFYIKIKSFMKNTNSFFKNIYNDYIDDNYFDNLNLMYVATTRATDQLIIFTVKEKNNTTEKTVSSCETVSSCLKYYLINKNIWKIDKNIYSFGIQEKKSTNIIDNNNISNYKIHNWISEPLSYKKYDITNLSEKRTILYYKINILDSILNEIYLENDLYLFLDKLLNKKIINLLKYNKLKNKILYILRYPILKRFFCIKKNIFLNYKIIYKKKFLTLNRIIISDKKLIIIDNYYSKKKYKKEILVNKYKKLFLNIFNIKIIYIFLIILNYKNENVKIDLFIYDKYFNYKIK